MEEARKMIRENIQKVFDSKKIRLNLMVENKVLIYSDRKYDENIYINCSNRFQRLHYDSIDFYFPELTLEERREKLCNIAVREFLDYFKKQDIEVYLYPSCGKHHSRKTIYAERVKY